MAAGDITTSLLSELGIRLEDADKVKFTDALKLQALNNSQKIMANLLNSAYLTELENIDSAVDASTGSILLSALNGGESILRGGEGIVKIQVTISATDIWSTEIELSDIKRTENSFLSGTDTNPLHYIFSSTINFLVTTIAGMTADVYYLTEPTEITADIDPILNLSLHSILLDLAEAYCWSIDDKAARGENANSAGMLMIKNLNVVFQPAKGVGTNNQKGGN